MIGSFADDACAALGSETCFETGGARESSPISALPVVVVVVVVDRGGSIVDSIEHHHFGLLSGDQAMAIVSVFSRVRVIVARARETKGKRRTARNFMP